VNRTTTNDLLKPSAGLEDHILMKRYETMLKLNLIERNQYKVANKDDTYKFAASGSHSSEHVWAASGTLPGLSDKERDAFIQTCPEIKIFYPSLSSPACFGSKVNPEKCGESICAINHGPNYHGSC
jgi:hypothetical protein